MLPFAHVSDFWRETLNPLQALIEWLSGIQRAELINSTKEYISLLLFFL